MTTPPPPPAELAELAGSLRPQGDGVHWTLDSPSQLNANLVRLGPGASIDRHRNAEVDVLLVVLDGTGTLTVDDRSHRVAAHVVAHVPRTATRRVEAGPDGLTYLTVHVRRGPLSIGGRPRTTGEPAEEGGHQGVDGPAEEGGDPACWSHLLDDEGSPQP